MACAAYKRDVIQSISSSAFLQREDDTQGDSFEDAYALVSCSFIGSQFGHVPSGALVINVGPGIVLAAVAL